MALYFVTVGKSLLTSSRCWNEIPDGLRNASWHDLADPRFLRSNLEAVCKAVEVRNQLLRELTDQDRFEAQAKKLVDKDVKPIQDAWENAPNRLPAELATLRGIKESFDGDRLVLLCGNDNVKVGYLLAAMIRQVINRADDGISVLTGYDWSLASTDTFVSGMDKVWERVREIILSVPSEALHFVLTGGYKGVLIDLTRRIVNERRRATLYYLHEDTAGRLIALEIYDEQPTPSAGPATQLTPMKIRELRITRTYGTD
jgi:hypothetical protein